MRAAEVTVIGGGAAGLMAAITAARSGARVRLLEGGRKPGAKILASGGSRCNLTHDVVCPENYSGGSRRVVARMLREFDARAAREFFEGLGVATKLEPTGKIFPVSDSAVTVRDALLRAADSAGVELWSEARVAALGPSASGGAPGIALVDGRELASPRVILATGGLSYPATGSRGDGLVWARELGHTIQEPIPALVPLVTQDGAAHALSGVTLEAELALRAGPEGRELCRYAGSFLFTHFGASGPAALNISRHFLRAREHSAAIVVASWLPGRSLEAAGHMLLAARERGGRAVGSLLGEHVPRRLAELLCARAGVEGGLPVAGLSREQRGALVRSLVEYPLGVTGTLGFDKAEVTAGGVELSQVDPSTLESRIVPGLHLCGEVLDVDGMLGGYNFQWAWSSGFVAGKGAARGAGAELTNG